MGGALKPVVQLTSSERVQQMRQYVHLAPSSSQATRWQSQEPVGIVRLIDVARIFLLFLLIFIGFIVCLSLFYVFPIMFVLLPVWFLCGFQCQYGS